MTDERRKLFARGWESGGRETKCGAGSTIASTAHIRPLLRPLFDRYGIRFIIDAGAGDLNWIRHVNLVGLEYRAYDLVPRHPSVIDWDITADALPACDLILCRAVLNHLGPRPLGRTLDLFRQSGKYLLATQFDNDTGKRSGWVNYDLREFGLGEPIERLRDNPGELALWRL